MKITKFKISRGQKQENQESGQKEKKEKWDKIQNKKLGIMACNKGDQVKCEGLRQAIIRSKQKRDTHLAFINIKKSRWLVGKVNFGKFSE